MTAICCCTKKRRRTWAGERWSLSAILITAGSLSISGNDKSSFLHTKIIFRFYLSILFYVFQNQEEFFNLRYFSTISPLFGITMIWKMVTFFWRILYKMGAFAPVMLLRTFRQPKAVENGAAENHGTLQSDGWGTAKRTKAKSRRNLRFSPSIEL